jgi:hypothetical protein
VATRYSRAEEVALDEAAWEFATTFDDVHYVELRNGELRNASFFLRLEAALAQMSASASERRDERAVQAQYRSCRMAQIWHDMKEVALAKTA